MELEDISKEMAKWSLAARWDRVGRELEEPIAPWWGTPGWKAVEEDAVKATWFFSEIQMMYLYVLSTYTMSGTNLGPWDTAVKGMKSLPSWSDKAPI